MLDYQLDFDNSYYDEVKLQMDYGNWLKRNCQCPKPDGECVCPSMDEWFDILEDERMSSLDYFDEDDLNTFYA